MDYLIRYAINGVVATAVHYAVLTFNLKVLGLPSAGLANVLAAGVGITTSFVGSRYFVFRKFEEPMLMQAARFGTLYALIAVLHGVVLFIMTDWLSIDYRIGFGLATILQVLTSYFGNKVLVFKV